MASIEQFARGPVWAAAAAQGVLLTVFSAGYDYHRDELYYRMLRPAWGYVDQPPMTPAIARMTLHLADAEWALRIPATLASALSVVVLAMITWRLGGGRTAQSLAAWGYATAMMPLMLGHVLFTSTIDLLLISLVVYALVVAVQGHNRWWVAAGLVVGLTTYNRWLIVIVVGGLVLGLLLLGPRRAFRTPWPYLGGVVAVIVGLPNLLYQIQHGWPQLEMGAALGAHNAASVRSGFVLMLIVLLGPPLVAVWGTGIVWLLRSDRRNVDGWLVVGFAVLLMFTFVGGAQPHYPLHLLSVIYAAGCVPVETWLSGHRFRQLLLICVVVINATVSIVLALPVIPLRIVGHTPVVHAGPMVADQIGWSQYVAQIARIYHDMPAPRPPILASNYGEAGALARYGPAFGLPAPYSGHVALYDHRRLAEDTDAVVVVGGQLRRAANLFGSCTVLATLDNGLGVDNEEQGMPVALCVHPHNPELLWPALRHLD
ncbi:glycosyltransferase family 39 protein [Aldersonia kunmingensis]|uniref:glycosyltransferase family 39 protein n=1 Tax=Aldersonia kunmingensis TaxID=408066 RepID=UPI00082C5E52|nr:glycosyltransferase family 39 protein [Aldersonia kunmingensis]